ncbi:Ig-like domain-containing protein [Acinetobacter gerneri]|uniref:Uncharacterized protein n=1 Tax=Acinetobacter gerneri DSM 14967 = CIP 107464 = MTCC 9824 TaxID=1120926 RepID=N8ZN95_9GAMM|nr:Ig-like domain-containing protein [Acinetobacter gerneri]ENV32975.1 hypothetical protein F960_02697 [Acinetobacter gerneri DSM 14967 = CIP 107464 = MTCC 9824]EPR84439.1 hypothetical protein L289_1416 [Acinetobacter gerneri DSM 14967 = CIP 107464 = MTCC 9824]
MPQISVISETSRKVLQQTNTINNIGLTENSLVVLSIATSDLLSVARSGTTLSITVANSQPITIANYFNNDGSTQNILALAPTNSSSIYQAKFSLANGATSTVSLSSYASIDSLLKTQLSVSPTTTVDNTVVPTTVSADSVNTSTNTATAKASSTSLLGGVGDLLGGVVGGVGTLVGGLLNGQPIKFTLLADNGVSNTDGITNNGTIVVSGLTATTVWQYSVDSGVTWKVATGSTQINLPQGSYPAGSVQVKITDATGEITAQTDQAYTIDMAAPQTPFLSLVSDTGTSRNDLVSSSGAVKVNNIEAGATWQYSLDGGKTWINATGNTFELAEGYYAFQQVCARVIDVAGNPSAPGYLGTATIDKTAPLAISVKLFADTGSNGADGITNDGTMVVGGIETNATWQYSLNGGTTWLKGTGTTFLVPGGVYDVNQIQVRQTDLAGNVGPNTPYNASLNVVTTLPTAPNAKLANDTGISATDGITNDGTVLVSNVPAGSTWQYSVDGGKTWINGTGSSFVTPEGNHVVEVRSVDVAGNNSTPTIVGSITVDTTKPTAPTVKLENDTGANPNDGITSDGTVLVSNVPTGSTWSYSTDGGKTWNKGSGSSFDLAPGVYPAGQVLVKATSVAGNDSANADAGALTIVNEPPATPVLTLVSDTGFDANDGITSNGTINVDTKGSSWSYTLDGGKTWTVGTGTAFVLPEGKYDPASKLVLVKSTNVAGESSPEVALPKAITVDTSAPVAPITTLAADTGISATDGITNNGTVNISGIEPNAFVQYSTDNGATWKFANGSSFVLTEGVYAAGQVQVKSTDLAGNASPVTKLGATTVDQTAPNAATIKLANDTGSSNIDGISSDGTIAVTGVETGATWQYSVDNGKTWLTGTGSSFVLAEGNYPAGQVQVRVVDAAGNLGTSTSAKAIVVDSTAPAAATLKLATDTGVSAIDGITNNGTINVTGLESGATWAYSTDGGKTWNVSTGTSFSLAEGTYAANQIQVKQTDTAGNTGAVSSISTIIVVDKTAPASASFSLVQDTGSNATDGVTNNGDIKVAGIETGASWQYSIDSGKTWVAGTGTSFTLAEGTYTAGQVQVKVQDAAGNTSAVTQNAQQLVIDKTAPNPATLALANDTGVSNTDGITADGTVNVSNVEAGATWQYSTDGGQTWKQGTNNNFVLANGTYADGTVKVRVTDLAGNTKDSSLGQIVVSNTAPTGITAKITGISDDTGNKGDWVTTDHTLTISGTITRALTSNEVVQISKDGGKTWINATTTSTTWSAVDPSNLATGKYNYQVRIVDLAGNATSSSTQAVNVVDLQANNDIANILGYQSLPSPVAVNQSSGLFSIAVQGFIIRADAATDSNAYTVGKGDVNNVVISSGSLGLGIQLSTLTLMIYKYNAATGNYEYYREDPNFGASISIIGGISGGSSNQTLTEGKYIFSVKQNGLGAAFYLGGMSVKGTSQDYGQLVTTGNAINDGNADVHTGSVSVVKVSSSTGASSDVGQDLNYSTTIQGQYGILKIAANGAYIYERDYNNSNAIGKVDTFTYTIKDQWGNTSDAKIYMQIGADGLVFDPNNPGDNASANITAVNDVYTTNNAIKVSQSKTVYSATDMDNKIYSPDSSADRGYIDFTGNAKGQTSVTSGFIFKTTDVNYASITIDGKSLLTLNYSLNVSYGSTVQLTVEKYVNGAWTIVSSGYQFTSSVSSNNPGVLSVYNYENTATEYRIVMNTSGSNSYSTNTAYFDNYGMTSSSLKVGSYSLSSNDVSGNVTSNDKGGIYAKVTDVNGTNVSSSGTTTINSTTGTGKLIIAADGSYTYSPGSVKVSDLGKIDAFNYTITAGKSVSSAQLVFHVTADGVIMSGGSSGTYTLNGTSGNDLFVSRGSNDEFNLNGGNDTLIYNLLNKNDATGGNGKDSVNGFTVMKSTNWNTDIDFIDVKSLLSDQAPTSANIKNFISSVQVKNASGGTDTVLLVDRDGTGTNYNPTELLTLKNVTTSVDELLQTKQLLF